MNPRFLIEQIANLLPRYAYRLSDETQLHAGVAQVLSSAGVEFEHERIAGEDRYDFWCSGVVIEAKIKGTYSEALRQIDRYVSRPDVAGVVLLTTKDWGPYCSLNKSAFRLVANELGEVEARSGHMPPSLRGKPFRMVRVRRQAL